MICVRLSSLAACDTTIEAKLAALTATADAPSTPLPRPRVTRRHGNEPAFELRTPLHHLTGADLTQIDGIAPYTALKLISELGTDMSRWPTEKQFTAWLTLARQNKVSGGRIGKPKAITATARKIAILVYRTLRGTLTYQDPGAPTYNARQRHRLLRRLRTQADTLGFTLLNRETGEVLEGTVS